MKQLGLLSGRILFILLYPLFALYLSKDDRARIIVRHGDKVLVVKSWLGTGAWDLPGGGLHKNENPIVGALRELQEEVGIVVATAKVRKVADFQMKSGLIRHRVHIVATSVDAQQIIQLQHREIADAQWVNDEQLVKLNIDDNYKRYARIVLRS